MRLIAQLLQNLAVVLRFFLKPMATALDDNKLGTRDLRKNEFVPQRQER